ncbi:MAG: adenosylmethionine decarboxylase, partial [Spirochaetota bacterium]
AGATIVSRTFHQFNPHGVSGVVIISESHLTIHTWPEHGYASLDLYTCGKETDSRKAFNYIRTKIGAQHTSTVELFRGDLEEIEGWQE